MSYLDAYLQPCPGFGWQGGPEFKTQIIEMRNGRERRNAENAFARHKFQSPFRNISKDAYRLIKQMHLVCRGRLHCFKFRDELDYQASNEVFGGGTGAQTVFQLRKISTVDGVSYIRNVYAIEEAVITVNGTPTAVTLDADRGEVTFAAPPAGASVLRWTGVFAVWVRFDQDYLPFSIDNVNAVNGSVDLIEVPPPEPEA